MDESDATSDSEESNELVTGAVTLGELSQLSAALVPPGRDDDSEDGDEDAVASGDAADLDTEPTEATGDGSGTKADAAEDDSVDDEESGSDDAVGSANDSEAAAERADDTEDGDAVAKDDHDEITVGEDGEGGELTLGSLEFDDDGLLVLGTSGVFQSRQDAYELRTSALTDGLADQDDAISLLRSTRLDDDELVPVEQLVATDTARSGSLFTKPIIQITTLTIGVLACLVLWQWRTSPPSTSAAVDTTVLDDDAVAVTGTGDSDLDAGEGETADAGVDDAAAEGSGEPEAVQAPELPALVAQSPLVTAVNSEGEFWVLGAGLAEMEQVADVSVAVPGQLNVSPFGFLFETPDGALSLWNSENGLAEVPLPPDGLGSEAGVVVDERFGVVFADERGGVWLLAPSSQELTLLELDEPALEIHTAVEGLALRTESGVSLYRPNGQQTQPYRVTAGQEDGMPTGIASAQAGLAVIDDAGRVWARDARDGQGGFVLAYDPIAGGSPAVDVVVDSEGMAVATAGGLVLWHDAATNSTRAVLSSPDESPAAVALGAFGFVGLDGDGNGWLLDRAAPEAAVPIYDASLRPPAVQAAVTEFGVVLLDELGDAWLIDASGDGDSLRLSKVYDSEERAPLVLIRAS